MINLLGIIAKKTGISVLVGFTKNGIIKLWKIYKDKKKKPIDQASASISSEERIKKVQIKTPWLTYSDKKITKRTTKNKAITIPK